MQKQLVLFLTVAFFWIACQPPQGIRRSRFESNSAADSVLYYQPREVDDPFLDSLSLAHDKPVQLDVIVEPPPPPPPPTHRQIDGFRVQLFAGIDSLNGATVKAQVEKSIDDSVYMFREEALFKIQAGDFPYRNDADMLVMDLRKEGFMNAWVVATQINIPISADTLTQKPQTTAVNSVGRYSIQLLATSTKTKAERLVQSLSGGGDKAFFKQQGELYKVYAGPYATREAAEQQLKTIRASGYPDAWIVEQKP